MVANPADERELLEPKQSVDVRIRKLPFGSSVKALLRGEKAISKPETRLTVILVQIEGSDFTASEFQGYRRDHLCQLSRASIVKRYDLL
jgi:hypothetical protein